MKIRNGFVSNSSSSSFVILTTAENHKKALEELTREEKEIILEIMKPSQFLGKEMMSGDEYENDSGYGTISNIAFSLNIDEYIVDDVWCKYQSLINKNKDEVFSHFIEW